MYTDNKALTHLKSIHPNNKNLTRWSHEIERWGCEIKHFEGKKNILADILSRMPVEDSVESDQLDDSPEEIYVPTFALTYFSNVLDKIKSEQDKDQDLVKIVKQLKGEIAGTNIDSLKQQYVVKNGILYRYIVPFPDKIDITVEVERRKKNRDLSLGQGPQSSVAVETQSLSDENGPSQDVGLNEQNFTYMIVPVVPTSLRKEIMNYFHSSEEFGHFGRRKTQESIKRRFFWHNMNTEIANFVRHCDVCQRYKSENLKKKGLMGFTPVAESVFETLYLDMIGPLIPSKGKRNRFIIVLVDQLSGWVELRPLPNAKSWRIVDFLEDVISHFGSPKAIITDNGTNFVSKVMKKFCKSMYIKQVTTSAFHPCTNRCERSNKDIVRMIASFADGKHDEWDKSLHLFGLALRIAVNESTGVSPSLLNLGREIRLPIDRSLNPIISSDYVKDAQNIACNIPDSLKKLIEDVRKNLRHVQEVNKFYHDEKRRHFEFKVGSLVWVRNNQLSDKNNAQMGKLCEKWSGPYKILSKNGLTYILDMPKKFVPKRHVSDLKPYFKSISAPKTPQISLRKLVKGLETETHNIRTLRPKKTIDYKQLHTGK